MTKVTQEILTKLKSALVELYGDRLKGLYLYGSFARGEEKSGSDLDVAMVLDDFERPWFEIERTSQIVADLSSEYEITVSVIPLRLSDWSKNEKVFVRNIQAECIAV